MLFRSNTDFSLEEDYNQIKTIAENIANAIPGATTSRVINQMKNVWKDNEIPFPRNPLANAKRMSATFRTMIDLFAQNPKVSLEECIKEVKKTGIKNYKDRAKLYYTIAYACSNRMTADEVIAELKG